LFRRFVGIRLWGWNAWKKHAEATMKISSSALTHGQPFDDQFTADGKDISPPLSWSDVPAGTVTLALICDDPDAPSPQRPNPDPWVHWVLFNIPAEVTALPAGIDRHLQPTAVAGASQGINSWPHDNLGYRGPAPPPGSGRHRYFFTLYALDGPLPVKPGATKTEVLQAMEGHVLAEAQLMTTYER
jgi:Raf kinase inhibitor-like YbhB/YbcL family protein